MSFVRWTRLPIVPVLLACAAALSPSGADAQGQYPDKPIKLIVPQAPGSATDTVARILASELGPQLGQTVIIENKPGAAFTIGLDLVAKAPPDGYTLGLGPIGALSISPNMIARIPYSIEKDFQPIALVSRGHLLLAVAPTSSY
jgi:tripartite-type tricarboxylate transporter receptor subunit TctC